MQPATLRPLTRPIVLDQTSLLGKVLRSRLLACCFVPSGLGVQLRLFAGCTGLPQLLQARCLARHQIVASSQCAPALAWLLRFSIPHPIHSPSQAQRPDSMHRELELGATSFSSPRPRSPHDEAGAPCTRLRAPTVSRPLTRTLTQAACSTSASRQ